MKKIFIIPTVILTLALITACHKDDHDHDKNDTEPPRINIIQPAASMFDSGDTVMIQIVVTDNIELHDVDVFINDKKTGAEVYKLYRHSHTKEVNINSWWVATAPHGQADYILRVKAEDAAGNTAEKTHEFHVH